MSVSFALPAQAQALTLLNDVRSVYDWSEFHIGNQLAWDWANQPTEDKAGLDGEISLNGSFFGPIASLQKQWSAAPFDFVSARRDVALEVRGGTRRKALERLFYDKNVVVEWRYQDVAEEAISGRYSGTLQKVALMLLERTNFMITYRPATNSAPLVTHVIVYGHAWPGVRREWSPRDNSIEGAEGFGPVPTPTNNAPVGLAAWVLGPN